MAHWQLGSRKRKSFGNGKFAGLTDPIDPMPQISPDWENFVGKIFGLAVLRSTKGSLHVGSGAGCLPCLPQLNFNLSFGST